MSEVIIKSDTTEERKPDKEESIKDTLKAADEYQKLKEENDKLEAEYLRQQELKAKITMGGRASAGEKIEKTPEEQAQEEASKILKMFE